MATRKKEAPPPRPCALCDAIYTPEEKSHIVPAFVYRWLKETSSTGRLRYGPQINRPVQDGMKAYLLCGVCEDRLGKHETAFSRGFFHPHMDADEFQTTHSLTDVSFAVGIAWRVLAYMERVAGLPHFRDRHPSAISSASETWKRYLLGNETGLGPHTMQLLPLFGIQAHTMEKMPENINRYLLRAVEIDVVMSDSEAFTYGKLGPLVFIGMIASEDPERWKNTRVEEGKKYMPGKTFEVPGELQEYLQSRARRLAELEGQISQRQWEGIEQRYDANRERAVTSGTLAAHKLDQRLRITRDDFRKGVD